MDVVRIGFTFRNRMNPNTNDMLECGNGVAAGGTLFINVNISSGEF